MGLFFKIVDGKLVLTTEPPEAVRHVRPDKGRSLLVAVDSFVAIDLETTGLSTDYDEIIEMAASRYVDGQKTESYSQLVNPGFSIGEFITELTGITDDMLKDQPPIGDVLPQFLAFVGDSVVVGHNVNFDINFLYDACESCELPPFSNDFVDTMRLGRKLHPEYTNHRLNTMIKEMGLPKRGLHRSEGDADLAAQIYLAMMAEPDFEQRLAAVAAKSKDLRAVDITARDGFINEDSPFYGKVCVFTGALESFTRRDAFQLVADIGGIPGDGVTQKTNFLILGNNDYCTTIKDGKSSKQKKAEKLIAAGADLQIIPESVFLEMLADDLRQS